jgi:lipopolysaccharide exporter
MTNRTKVAKGAALLTLMRVSIRVIGLISTVILARLLVPEDFGLVALSVTYIAVIVSATAFSGSTALIQISNPSVDHYNTTWTISLIRGISLSAIVFLTSFIVDDVFNEPRLTHIVWVLSVIPMIDSCINPKFIDFEKNLDFSKEFRLQILTKLIGFTITVTAALIFKSYWALIAGNVITSFSKTLISHLLVNYKPKICLLKWREILKFTGWLTANSALNSFSTRIDTFVIASAFGTAFTGIYHIANQLSTMVTTEISYSLARSLYPAFSNIKHDPIAIEKAVKRSIGLIALFTLPLAVGFSLIAQDFILIIYGEKWREAASIVTFLAPALAVPPLLSVGYVLALALGKPKQTFYRDLCNFTVKVPLIILGTYFYGFEGLVATYIFSSTALFLLNASLVHKNTNLSYVQILQGIMAPALASISMVYMVTYVSILVPAIPDYQSLMLKITVGTLSYSMSILLLYIIKKDKKDTAEFYVYSRALSMVKRKKSA